MRKLKLQVQMTVDGYIAGPNGELNFMTWDWDEEMQRYVEGLTADVDCIVLGRNLAEGFIPHWAAVAADAENPEQATGQLFTDTPKVVFSRTLDEAKWDNTAVASGDLVDEITRLKAQAGGDIIAYGGARFVSDLIKHGLIDEYHLFVNPAAIGSGMTIFGDVAGKQELALVQARAFDCGIVLLNYEPRHRQA